LAKLEAETRRLTKLVEAKKETEAELVAVKAHIGAVTVSKIN
jgi:hypothetical protein